MCGGTWVNSIYLTVFTPSIYPYEGCYKDNTTRDLSLGFLYSPNMTVELCQVFCLANGTLYFGVQDSIYCFCGSTYGKYGSDSETNCNMTCGGNSTEICGGPYHNSVYSVFLLQTTQQQTTQQQTTQQQTTMEYQTTQQQTTLQQTTQQQTTLQGTSSFNAFGISVSAAVE